jgi:cytochrome bd-type quinol oxidase subunit 2
MGWLAATRWPRSAATVTAAVYLVVFVVLAATLLRRRDVA